MFILGGKYVGDRPPLQCDFIRYTPKALIVSNIENAQIYNDITREDGDISLKDNYLELEFTLTHKAVAPALCADGNQIWIVHSGPVVLINKNELATSNGKEVENIDESHIGCLMCNLLTS